MDEGADFPHPCLFYGSFSLAYELSKCYIIG